MAHLPGLGKRRVDVGLATGIFGRRPTVEQDLIDCRACGVAQIEACILPGWIDPGDEKTIAALGNWAAKHGVRIRSVHGPSGWPGNPHWLADPDEEKRAANVAERRQVMRSSKQLGARYVVVEYECYGHAPYWPHESPVQQYYPGARALWLRSFEELLEEAARTGIKLGIENIDGLPCADLAEVVSKADAKLVGVCFDSSHATYGRHFFEELEYLLPFIIGTHLSDNDALPGRQWSDRHWFPYNYAGDIDWDRLVSKLVTSSPCDCLTVEVLSEKKQITPPLVEALGKMRAAVAAATAS